MQIEITEEEAEFMKRFLSCCESRIIDGLHSTISASDPEYTRLHLTRESKEWILVQGLRKKIT